MANNQQDNRNDANRPGQDSNRNAQNDGKNQHNQRFVNNPSGENRGKNTGDYNPNSPTGQNIPGRDPERNNEPQKGTTPEVPDREEQHETKIPKAENQTKTDESETYGDFDQNDSAASQ